MASINDWAAKAANRIADEVTYGKNRNGRSVERIAAIIATYAAPLLTLLEASRRSHLHVEDDTWYCCGACAHPCDNDEGDHEHDESCCVDSHDGASPREQGVCNCGATAWNAKVDAALSGKDVS